MPGNVRLAALMRARGLSQMELAEQINDAVERLTRRRGNASDRTVRRYLSGETSWPQGRQRLAMEAVFGCTAEELGFTPPACRAQGGSTLATHLHSPQEEPVHRRTFIAASTGTVLSATSLVGAARPTVGTADVQRLRNALTALWLLDDQEGGGPALEGRAVALSQKAMDLQQNGSAAQRIRGRLYGLAAAFTATAMWAAVDSRQLDRAQRHMESAVTLAGLSGEGQVQHQTWRYAAMLADQRGRPADALAAAEAAMSTSIHRRDPLYAALSHSRLALSLPGAGDPARAQRALGRAFECFDRADPFEHRPASMDFFTRGELHGLAGITYLRLQRPDEAESHMHQCLTALRPDQHRNRAYYKAHMALAQLAQNDFEQACATAAEAIPPRGSGGTGRIPHLLQAFTTGLNARAPGSGTAREWNDRARTP
ncbi:Tat pathway signal protein [Streptomyces klenkii]|uniref:Tat pathway signal protein n=1 Tax=Streptomyces klenkii TaxID=1420899 RepID=A0A3B0BV10_9ACTN|nr:helix-turn-helix transcriptional regulator [Streptomyces klenkii]RKN76311.1 Tat pathway signal protein [Streptomyces klenkii]